MAAMWWFVTMCVGFLFELVGLALAAVGLWQTWSEHAGARPFFPLPVRRAGHWIRTHVLRRPPPAVSVGVGAGTITLEASASGYASNRFNDQMTLEEKVETAQDNALRALEHAAKASDAIRTEVHDRKRAIASLEEQVAAVDSRVTDFAKGLILDGIPLTVFGLGCAVFGLLLQGLANVVTFPGV